MVAIIRFILPRITMREQGEQRVGTGITETGEAKSLILRTSVKPIF
jgi:hypothetical protein